MWGQATNRQGDVVDEEFEWTVDGDGPSVLTVRPRGRLDVHTATQLRSAVHKKLVDHPEVLVIDLAGLVVVDDVVLTVFPALAKHAATISGTVVALCCPSVEVRQSLHALGIERHVTMGATWSEAVLAARQLRSPQRLSLTLQPVVSAAAVGRSLVDEAVRIWRLPLSVADRVRAVVTELVSNAVTHAGTRAQLVLRLSARYVHVAVWDGVPEAPRLVGPENVTSEGGRGLILVDAFATSWGYQSARTGKVVWATVRHGMDL